MKFDLSWLWGWGGRNFWIGRTKLVVGAAETQL